MTPEVREMYVAALRYAHRGGVPKVTGMEMYKMGLTEAFDAFAILCGVHAITQHPSVTFVPMRGNPNSFFYFPRADVLVWSGITENQIEELIEMNDVLGLSFAEIADTVESGAWD